MEVSCMKKIIMFLCLILSTICFASCNCSSSDTQIVYSETSIVLYENTTHTIDIENVKISSKNKDFKVYSLDENIAKVEDLEIYPKSIGKTKIRFELIDNSEIYCDVNLEVKKGKIAKTVSVQKPTVNIDITDKIYTSSNKLITNEDCDEIPTITYENDVAIYDYKKGIVIAQKVGTATISVDYLFCSVSFRVVVVENTYVTTMAVDDCKVYSNSKGVLPFQVFPLDATKYSFSLSVEDKDRDDFIIHSDGSYQSFGATKISLRYSYETGKNIITTKSFQVEVVDKISDFSYLIKDSLNSNAPYFVKEKEYTLILQLDNSLGTPNISISSDDLEKSTIEYDNALGYKTTFKFKSSGDKTITITYSLTLGGVQNIVTKEIPIHVADKSIMKIVAKWQVYELQPISEGSDKGKYRIYLDGNAGEGKPNSLTIGVKINNAYDPSFTYSTYQVISDDNKVLLSNNVFIPQTIGEYTLEVVCEGESIGEIVVLVQ